MISHTECIVTSSLAHATLARLDGVVLLEGGPVVCPSVNIYSCILIVCQIRFIMIERSACALL